MTEHERLITLSNIVMMLTSEMTRRRHEFQQVMTTLETNLAQANKEYLEIKAM